MSSRSSSASSTAPTTAKLSTYITELVTLARQTLNSERSYSEHYSRVSLCDEYFKLQTRINNYFTKKLDLDFQDHVARYQVLVIKTLLGMIETGLGRGHGDVEWPVVEEEREGEGGMMKKRVAVEVEEMVFGRQEVKSEVGGVDGMGGFMAWEHGLRYDGMV